MYESESRLPPEEEPVTARDEADEPAGDEDPANEEELLEAKESVEEENPLARSQRERDEYLDLARRAQADFENYRKRAAREASAAGERAKSGFVRELLPVVDNLERALASAAENEQHLAAGVRLVHSELIAVLERHGVKQFDPDWHEAMLTRPANEDAAAGTIVEVLERGYRLNGQVLRPARVVVAQ